MGSDEACSLAPDASDCSCITSRRARIQSIFSLSWMQSWDLHVMRSPARRFAAVRQGLANQTGWCVL